MNYNLDYLKKIISKNGHKTTPQKLLILEVMINDSHHLSAKDIHDKLKQKNIGLATIYRSLNLFIELNIIKKVAIALTDGKAIKIDGGNYRASFCKFKCFNCGELYEINYEQDKHKCPSCASEDIICSKKAGICKKWCDKNK
ncbi:hypothetical protein GCM10008904_24430 [Paraclostridium ghonii]|uniref:Fe2+ or Zn2+ uptake regulation protein n=1 Tax=Paraclostridium ghonii TaxID=29358 RepID=A0ABU0MZC7_9FIRM|nr:transcriptional repressor [Paeniclostridium ghonii]MDQ0556205.1 Fe2+ or Zn2+ uptake regulation protein [Paeniclostridium ghonii]